MTLLKYLLLFPLFTFCSNGQTEAGVEFAPGEKYEQSVTIPPLPDKLSFASEAVPIDYFDVREAILREMTVITYWHSSMTQILLLDNRFGKVIKEILKEEKIPQDFYYLCIAESGLHPAVSGAGAAGYWQFLEGTAKEYGLVVNDEVDERYNLEKSTRAACAYFKKAYATFGSWTMAAASYNIGMSNVKYRIEKQSIKNYYDMQFPEETARYLFRALAFKSIMADPKRYGFVIDEEYLYRPFEYKKVEVEGPIANWSDFAAEHKTNFKLLKIFNPWIRANNMENKQKNKFVVKVPVEGFREKR